MRSTCFLLIAFCVSTAQAEDDKSFRQQILDLSSRVDALTTTVNQLVEVQKQKGLPPPVAPPKFRRAVELRRLPVPARFYGGEVTADNPMGLRTAIPLAKTGKVKDPQTGVMVVPKSTNIIRRLGSETFQFRTYDHARDIYFPVDVTHGEAGGGSGGGSGGGAAQQTRGTPRRMDVWNGGNQNTRFFPTDEFGNAGPFNVPDYGTRMWYAWQKFRLDHAREYPNDLSLNLAWLRQS
jgi:hypothetical protein